MNDLKFPREPYPSQVTLSTSISDIKKGQLLVAESPTGTGKTIALLLGLLNWLEKYRKGETEILDMEDAPDWMSSYEKEMMGEEMKKGLRKLEKLKSRYAKYSEDIFRRDRSSTKSIANYGASESNDCDWISDKTKTQRPEFVGCAVYASRTHSQLSQTLEELRALVGYNRDKSDKIGVLSDFTCVSLASRSVLCNEEVVKNSLNVDSSCKMAVADGKCKRSLLGKVTGVISQFIGEITGVKELKDIGERYDVCPYAVAKKLSKIADLILVPHQLIYDVIPQDKRCLVVVDEAHNLPSSQRESRESYITDRELIISKLTCEAYLMRYRSVIGGVKATWITTTTRFVDSILTGIKSMRSDISYSVDNFILLSKNNTTNMTDIEQFLGEMEVLQKMAGTAVTLLCDTVRNKKCPDDPRLNDLRDQCSLLKPSLTKTEPQSALTCLYRFVRSLNLSDNTIDTQVVVSFNPEKNVNTSISVMSMTPGSVFDKLVKEIRGTVLAAGTISPVEQFLKELEIPYTSTDKPTESLVSKPTIKEDPPDKTHVTILSLGHIIQPSQLSVCALSTIPGHTRDIKIRYTFESRDNSEVSDGIVETISKIRFSLSVGGMVVFMPSHSVIAKFHHIWDHLGKNNQTLFWEGESEVFERYKRNVNAGGKPILFAVVGGTLSEGIDFKDDLCRCVVIVGIPFENFRSPRSIAQKQYFEGTKMDGKTNSNELLSYSAYSLQSSFRRINQCIGRCIRHAKDWASCVLIDERYTEQKNIQLLSSWIKPSYREVGTVNNLCKLLATFVSNQI